MYNANCIEKIAIGTVQFGLNYGISNESGKTAEQEVIKILEYAWNNKITTLDTARAYGESERVLGEYVKHPFKVITKISPDAITANAFFESVEKSLSYLDGQYIEGLLIHDVNSLIQKPDLWACLKELKEQHNIHKIGYSVYYPYEIEMLTDLNIFPEIIQLPFSFFDQRFKHLFKKIKSMGCEIHVRSVFLQGLYFLNPEDLPDFFEPVKFKLKDLQSAFKDKNSLIGWLLAFALNQEEINKVIIGVNNVSQLKTNLLSLQNEYDTTVNTDISNIPERILIPSLWPQKKAI